MGAEKQKLEGIQIARAIAALSVCYYHSWTVLDRFPHGTAFPIPGLAEYGWLGVDLFFGISGFVICLVLTRPSFRPGQFLVRRLFRIYPLWLATLSLFALMAWGWRGLLPTETLGNFLYSATLLPTQGYPFYDIGWSLQHEIAFYLIALATVPMFGLAGLIVVLSLSIAANHFLSLPWYLAQLASYHPEFLAGLLAFLVAPRVRWVGALLPIVIGTIVTIAIVETTGDRRLYPFPLFFIVVGFANVGQAHGPGLGAALGDASYSLYLVHPLVFATVKSATKFFDTNLLWIEEPLRFASIGIAILISLLSWRHFEKPMIEIGENVTSATAKARWD